MVGRPPPDIENPCPDTASELIVTATFPLEVTVTDLVTAVPTETFPNARELALRLRDGTAPFNCKPKLRDDELDVAVRVAVCVLLTEATLALKEADEAPAATFTLDGTVTALELLARDTLCPPV